MSSVLMSETAQLQAEILRIQLFATVLLVDALSHKKLQGTYKNLLVCNSWLFFI